jgi:hypothetical protein
VMSPVHSAAMAGTAIAIKAESPARTSLPTFRRVLVLVIP